MSQKNRNNNTKKNYTRKNSPPIPTKLQIVVETNLPHFTPFRIEDVQSNGSNPFISAPKRGILNENCCKKFKYDPQLTLPSAPSHNVYFNPLQPLDEEIIKKIPRKSRVLEFFNSQMFHKLNQYTRLFRPPIKSLKEATEKGIVDNNIRITLKTLFSTNSVFYINREKYYIEFFEWQEGNWALETSNPQLYSEEELYGPNFNRPMLKMNLESQSDKKNIKNQLQINNTKLVDPSAPPLDPSAPPLDPPLPFSGGRTRRKYYNPYYQHPYYYQKDPYYQNYNFRNRTYKKDKPRIKKYYRGPNYKIHLFLGLKKGEKLTEEELRKVPCKKNGKR